MKSKAVVLLSGGLDSTTTLAIAKNQGFEIYPLSFDYGQRHRVELEQAKIIAQKFKVADHQIMTIDLRQFGGPHSRTLLMSPLTGMKKKLA